MSREYKEKSVLEIFSPDHLHSHNKRWEQLIWMMLSREADRREDILFRQGRGQFHVSGAGHESIAVLARFIKSGDHIYCHYRDRALVMSLGVPLYQTALGYFAKKESGGGGRQLVNHFCDKNHNIMPAATPVSLQCLPAAGSAWALKLKQTQDIAVCLIGDAGTRQGEFFEALAFCIEKQLPLLFVVEDNGYGISTPTHKTSPAALDLIPEEVLYPVDGRNIESCEKEFDLIINEVRSGKGPKVLWLLVDRLTSHTGSDDHSRYRDPEDLEEMKNRDILEAEKKYFLDNENMSHEDFKSLEKDLESYVKSVYERAESAEDPDPQRALDHVFASSKNSSLKTNPVFDNKDTTPWNMVEAWNQTLEYLLEENSNTILFGQDIEDPKGGVFGLTKGLSNKYPNQVYNAPLAEATIAGLASGLSMSGFMPIFEIQFADFLGHAFNQIVNQIATLRWRSNGEFSCPLVLYAPCGSYISNGGPWHNQTNESWFAHAPGIKVLTPSNANDAARLLYTSAHGEDPVLILLPKNQFRSSCQVEQVSVLHPYQARIIQKGGHITFVSWGNCVSLVQEAAQELASKNIECEIIDLCSLVPCDWNTIKRSVQKTGRLVVVQEDNKSCSFGQAIIQELCADQQTWDQFYAAPELVSRADIHIGFSKQLERAVLPNTEHILQAAFRVLGGYNE